MYFDAHTHVQFAAFKEDWQVVVERALENNVRFLNVGTQRDTSEEAIQIAKRYPGQVFAAVGLHPIHTEKSHHDIQELGTSDAAHEFTSRGEVFDYDYYKSLAVQPEVVAIGEFGLDYYRLGDETKKKQLEVFESHVRLAKEVGKPLMIHCRNAFSDLIQNFTVNREMLNDTPGVIHFFTGTKDDARALLDLGFAFTFGGVLTFTRDYDEVVKYIPVDRILSETDAPYITPTPFRGQRNEPMYVKYVVQKLAELKDLAEEEMAEKILENGQRIFRIG